MGKENTAFGMSVLRSAFETPEHLIRTQNIPILTAADVISLSEPMTANFGTDTMPALKETNAAAVLQLPKIFIPIPIVNIGPVSLMFVDARRPEFTALSADLGRLAGGLLPDAVGTLTSKKSMPVCSAAMAQVEAETGKKCPRVTFVNSTNMDEVKMVAGTRPIIAYKPITAGPGEVKFLTTGADDANDLITNDRLVLFDDVDSSGATRMAARIYRAMIRGNKVPQAILDNLADGIVLSETKMQAIEAGLDPTGVEDEMLISVTRLKRRTDLLKKLQLPIEEGQGSGSNLIAEIASDIKAYEGAVIAQATALGLNNIALQQLALTVAGIEMAMPDVTGVCLAQEFELTSAGEVPKMPAGVISLFRIQVIVN